MRRLIPTLLAALATTALLGATPAVPRKPDAANASLAPAPRPAVPAADKPGFYASTMKRSPPVADMTALGRLLFADASLSASGRVACATCHDPARAYGPPDGRSVQIAGTKGRSEGSRAVPSLRYVQNVPSFTEHFHEGENDSVDQGPSGGHTWDGRALTVHDQARLPLLSANEMGNRDERSVVDKVRRAPYADRFRALFGADVFDDPVLAFNSVLLVLEVFQQSPADFYPYSSRYDGYLRGQNKLSAQEMHGLELFNAADKGNCASCHPSTIKEGAFPAFTDWGFIALGVPRNRALAVNRDRKYFDLGLCGPLRLDWRGRREYCGLFRAPTLRNVARRGVFFHNGVLHRLEDVVAFYAQRDSNPGRWYPRRADGHVDAFDDVPPAYRDNINLEPPFGNRGGRSALSRREIADVVAFLKTLDDAPSPAVDTATSTKTTTSTTRTTTTGTTKTMETTKAMTAAPAPR